MPVAEKHHLGRIRARVRDSALTGPLILLAVTVAFFWKLTLTRQYTWLDGPDLAYQVLPWYQMQAREFHAGRVPLWDPYQWGGQPLIGQMLPGTAYPLNWLLFGLPLRDGRIREEFLNAYFVGIHFMAALFCYWLCRELRRSRAASLLAGATFGLGGYIGFTDWPQMLNGAVWAPLILLFFLRALRGASPYANSAWAGASFGMALLSGHHQIPIFIGIMMAGLWLYFIYEKGELGVRLALLFGLFALLVGSLQVLPAWEYGHRAVRWVGASRALGWSEPVPYVVHSAYSTSPAALLGVLVPGLFPAGATAFLGLTAALLGIIGLSGAWHHREVRLAAAIAAGGIGLSLGANSLLHGWLYALLPAFEKARNPSSAILIFHLGVSVLIAYGFEYLRNDIKPRLLPVAIRWLVGLGALLWATLLVMKIARIDLTDERTGMAAVAALALAAVLQLRSKALLGSRALAGWLLFLLLFEFSSVSTAGLQPRESPNPHSPLKKLAQSNDVAEFFKRLGQPVRVEVEEQAVPYNFGDWHGIDAFDGYSASLLANVDRVQGSYQARMRFGVNYALGSKPLRERQTLVYESSDGLRVYLNPEAKPRVWAEHPGPCPAGDRVELAERGQSHLSVRAVLGCQGTVVVGEAFYPGWEARLDGRPVPIREVHGCLRAVDAGAGEHRIQMRYRPLSVILGAALTGLGWLGCLGVGLVARRRRTALPPAAQ